MKDLSIIIVSYNNKNVLEECLDSIKHYNDIGEKLQTIVVEQSESDDIYNWAKEKYPWVDAIRAENKGFGAGNNRGAEIAEADVLLFLNPDTILVEELGEFAVDKFRKNENLGLMGVKLMKRDNSFCSSFQMLIPYGIVNKIIYRICSKKDIFINKRMYIEGADMFVRRKAFDEAGQFDESIFMYCEEADLCERIRRAGYALRYFKDKRIIHLQGACSDDKLARVYSRQLESFKYICGKFGWNFRKIMRSDARIWKTRAFLGINKKLSEEVLRIEKEAIG